MIKSLKNVDTNSTNICCTLVTPSVFFDLIRVRQAYSFICLLNIFNIKCEQMSQYL